MTMIKRRSSFNMLPILSTVGVLIWSNAVFADDSVIRFDEKTKASEIVKFLKNDKPELTRNSGLPEGLFPAGDVKKGGVRYRGIQMTPEKPPAQEAEAESNQEAQAGQESNQQASQESNQQVATSEAATTQATQAQPTVQAEGCNAVGAPFSVDIKFALNSYRIESQSGILLNEIATAMKDPSLVNCVFAIEGHTDATGHNLLNQTLSENRARSVGAYLQTIGLSLGRIEMFGKGSSEPLKGTDPYDGVNRRVQFFVLRGISG
jgi:outer membrane protein OmpA-like peptidoglycan-associated protein